MVVLVTFVTASLKAAVGATKWLAPPAPGVGCVTVAVGWPMST
jgi:hypothetical protein